MEYSLENNFSRDEGQLAFPLKSVNSSTWHKVAWHTFSIFTHIIFIHMDGYIHMCRLYMHVYMYVYMYMHVNVYMYIHICIYI